MFKLFRLDLHSLPAQMILGAVALVLLTAAAAGLPAIWLVRDQLERQAWVQLEQASRSTEALYAAEQSDTHGLAILTAQRPTLQRLMTGEDQASLLTYLRTLQTGAELDMILLCDPTGQTVAQVGEETADHPCKAGMPTGSFTVMTGLPPQIWLLAAHPVTRLAGEPLGTIVVGKLLDDHFASLLSAKTGPEQSLLAHGEVIATSLADRSLQDSTFREPQGAFSLGGRPFYFTRIPLSEPGLEAEVALQVTDIIATQRQLIGAILGGIVAVAIVASLLSVFLARRISRPLEHLARAATLLSKGDLARPLVVRANVREVALVAQALEGARVDLQSTLAELRHEKDWTDHLLEAIVEGIVTLDRHGQINFFSRGAERITGWTRNQVIGRACDKVFRPAETDEPFSRLIPALGQRRNIPVKLRDGRMAVLAVSSTQLHPPAGDAPDIALVFRDVSEEESVHRLLAYFLANVSHEFRTPLSALAASVELLLDQAPDLSPAELQELLTALRLSVLSLQTLVDNLLESASIEAGRFQVSPRLSNLGEIIAEAIRMMQPLLDRRGQHLVVELPAAIPVVRAAPRRTVQVLVNLLSNASKYAPDNSEIAIGATVDKAWVRVTVADPGAGIPQRQRADLFRRFVHPDTASDNALNGAGLGLSVVKAVIQAHGGEVGIEDRPGGGAVFWFTLPTGS